MTINTHKGLFEYKRLPFGVASAPSIFQRVMENLLQGIKVVCVYIDDILITGSTEEEHLRNLAQVLQRLESVGMHLKKPKCAFLLPSVAYLGHIIYVGELRSFLGMVMIPPRKWTSSLAGAQTTSPGRGKVFRFLQLRSEVG